LDYTIIDHNQPILGDIKIMVKLGMVYHCGLIKVPFKQQAFINEQLHTIPYSWLSPSHFLETKKHNCSWIIHSGNIIRGMNADELTN
jgi:hypothetical protein